MSEPRDGAGAVGVEAIYGCQSMTAKLRRVLLRNPDEASGDLWGDYGWRAAPNFARLLREQEGVCELLSSAAVIERMPPESMRCERHFPTSRSSSSTCPTTTALLKSCICCR